MTKLNCLAVLALFSAGISTADADQTAAATNNVASEQPMFKLGGFGTLGLSHSSQGLGDYVVDTATPKGAGLSNDWSATNNSRFAAHVNANFTPNVSALLQIDSEYHADGTYRPEVEWFSVKYAFTPNFYMRVGRIALPTFMDSENWDVGYSYTWVTPPVDLYHQLSIPSSDGIDAMYRTEIGDAVNTLKAIYGRNTFDRPYNVTTSKEMWGIFDTIEYGQTTYHASYQQRMSSTQYDLTGVTGAWIRNSDISFGISYDPGDWFAMSEWIQRRSDYVSSAMYASAGYRINKFTPYFTYSQNSAGSFNQAYPPPASSDIQLANRAQSTDSLGVRWDFMRNYDLKFQYDRVTLSDHSNGYLINVPPNIVLYGTTFHVISAVVDFVF